MLQIIYKSAVIKIHRITRHKTKSGAKAPPSFMPAVVQKARFARLLYNEVRLHRSCSKFSQRSPIVQLRFCEISFLRLRKATPRYAAMPKALQHNEQGLPKKEVQAIPKPLHITQRCQKNRVAFGNP